MSETNPPDPEPVRPEPPPSAAAFNEAPTGPAVSSGKVSAASLVSLGERGIQLRNFEELIRFAEYAVRAGAAPKGMTTGQAAIAIQAGLEHGLGLLGGLQTFVVINGLLSWRGQAAVAKIRNSGLCKPGTLKFGSAGKGTEQFGFCEAWRIGDAELTRREFTYEDAVTAHLIGKSGPWTDYPGRQFQWRAVGFLARDVFSDLLGGFPLAEEAVDFKELPSGSTAADQRQRIEAVESRAAELPPAQPDPLFQMIAQGKKKAAAPAVIDLPTAKEQEQATLMQQLQASVAAVAKSPEPTGTAVLAAASEILAPVVKPPEEPVPVVIEPVREVLRAAAPKVVPLVPLTRCNHAPAIKYLTPFPVGRNVVCEECTLVIVKEAGPLYTILEEPPK